ncbi:S-layer homology domain-containing protein [Paenibacillus pasadenensis]|nr:S-layer homology domain-containing protein [Paenibacillus pasadenensis]
MKQSDWYYSSIQKLISKGYVNGFADGTFKPQKEISRAEFIKLVGAALQLDVPAATETWYTPFVNAAVAAGIHKTSEYNGGWSQPITRQEMARLTVRAVDEKLRQGKTTDPQLVYEAAKRGILSGLSGGELGLKEKSTRAQATVVIDRVLTLLDGGTLPMDKRAASYAEVAYKGTNVGTMWGGEIRSLPFEAALSYNVDAKFEQILIIDPADPNGPYRDWVKGLVKFNGKSPTNDYVVAFKVTMKNKKIVPKEVTSFRALVAIPKMTGAMVLENKNSPFMTEYQLKLSANNKLDTWALFSIDKTEFNDLKRRNYPFFYFVWYSNNKIEIPLNDKFKGRIFGEDPLV